MCTVSFIPCTDSEYLFGSNRDELKSRSKADFPDWRNEKSWFGPLDSKAGGTWFGINRHGTAASLINNYQGKNPLLVDNKNAKSRGLIIPAVLQLSSKSAVSDYITSLTIQDFNPFELIMVFQDPMSLVRWSWNGKQVSIHNEPLVPQIWISSGKSLDIVTQNRLAVFVDWCQKYSEPTLIDLREFHCSQYPERGALSVAMHQEIVQTVSTTLAHVKKNRITMDYCDGYPVQNAFWERKDELI